MRGQAVPYGGKLIISEILSDVFTRLLHVRIYFTRDLFAVCVPYYVDIVCRGRGGLSKLLPFLTHSYYFIWCFVYKSINLFLDHPAVVAVMGPCCSVNATVFKLFFCHIQV